MSGKLTVDVVKALVPKSQRSMITDEFIDLIESGAEGDPDLIEVFKSNFVTYVSVLSTGKYKLTDYLSAVKFVSCKLLGMSDLKAWIATFPDRYQRMTDSGKSYDSIACHVSMYKKGQLVQQIFEQTIIPSHILNNPLYQSTLERLGKVFNDEAFRMKSPTAWVKAGEAILMHTKAPDTTKIQLDIGANQLDHISDLREVTANLIKAQKELIEGGHVSLKEIAESNIVEANYEDIDE